MTAPTDKYSPSAGLTGQANNAYQTIAGNAYQNYANSAANPYIPSQSPQTQQYIQGLTQMGQQGTPLTGAAQNGLLGVLNSNGMNGNTQNGLNNIGGIANGTSAINTGGAYQNLAYNPRITTGNAYQNFVNGAASPNAIRQYLTNYANGSQIGASNPLLQKVLAANDTAIANNVNLNASMGGRYGSGAYQGLLTTQLANANNAATLQQMNQDQQNQINAAGMLSGEQQNGFTDRFNALNGLTGTQQSNFTNSLNALNGLTGVQGQNIANQMNAANSQIGAGQTANQQALLAAGMAPSIYSFQQAPNQLLGQAGQIQDAFNQQARLAGNTNLQNYAQTVGGILSPFAGQAQVTKGASPLQTGVGMAATGLGVLGSL